MLSGLSTKGITPYCGVSPGLGPLGYWEKDLSLDAHHAGSPGRGKSNPQISGCGSNDAILAIRKLEPHFILQDKYGNASSLEHYFQK